MAAAGRSGPMGSAAATPAPQELDEYGLQVRPMGLKVHYTFDKDSQVRCLARWPQNLQIQAIPLDETQIGVVDLRTCLMAVAHCSPEIVHEQDTDYTVYAYDYSEPDVPLVGQGMLSWGLDPNADPQAQQFVTGRITKGLLAIFGNGGRETLEVKLKLTAVPKIQRAETSSGNIESQQPMRSAPTPTAADPAHTEWSSFVQSNPGLGRSASVAAFPSPSFGPTGGLGAFGSNSRSPEIRSDGPQPRPSRLPNIAPAPPKSSPGDAPSSQQPPPQSQPPPLPQQQQQQQQQHQPSDIGPERPSRPSRPSSRASRKAPTGRPRGRPRKRVQDAGSTSAAEEATDADDGPQRKRAKVVKADHNSSAPFGSAPDSLRVAASTSGSLRNMRPIAAAGNPQQGGHLHDGPRAPTPIPEAQSLHQQQQKRRRGQAPMPRRMSFAEFDATGAYQSQFDPQPMSFGMALDERSPTDSYAQSPDQGYFPEESPADLGSSPPVPRAGAYMHSSPMPSSPILPPMPIGPVDSGFMSGGIDDFFDDDEFTQDLPCHEDQADPLPSPVPTTQTAPQPPAQKKRQPKRRSKPKPQPPSQPQTLSFQEVLPGPPELLPVSSIYNPTGKARSLYMATAQNMAAPPNLERANTAPELTQSEPEPVAQPMHHSPPQDVPQAAPNAASLEMVDNQDATSAPEAAAPLPSQPSRAEPTDVSTEPANTNTSDTDAIKNMSDIPPNDTATHDVALTGSVEEARLDKQPPEPPTRESEPPAPTPAAQSPAACAPPAPMSTTPAPTKAEPADSRPPSRRDSEMRDTPALALTVPASDSLSEMPSLTLPQALHSEVPEPLSADGADAPRYNRNQVKKQSIKERLENAIQRGEMPCFCNNCGAIETPTWRKIWTQEHRGVPAFYELSDKPGFVTTVDILERDDAGQPKLHRIVKKSLGPDDHRRDWKEFLLCNPCGIWLTKFKSHRPADRWDKDAARLNQTRRKRDPKSGNSRSRKSRAKSNEQFNPNPTSEANFPAGLPTDPMSQNENGRGRGESEFSRQGSAPTDGTDSQERNSQPALGKTSPTLGPSNRASSGSTHSRGSGTADSPIPIEDDLGATRRLLFPSPRKEGVPKVLGEVAVNLVQTRPLPQDPEFAAARKELVKPPISRLTTPPPPADRDDLDHQLFGTPPPGPSTPPPKGAGSGPFKTPTRPTPSHRPITRSISRSIRSVKSIPRSPSQALGQLQRTPSKTPRSSDPKALGLSASKRRTPRHPKLHAHFAIEDGHAHVHFDSPFTTTLNQLLSEANGFTSGSPSHGLVDLDLSSLPNLDSDDLQHHLSSTGPIDFGNFLSTDLGMPSSPPLVRSHPMDLSAPFSDFEGSEL